MNCKAKENPRKGSRSELNETTVNFLKKHRWLVIGVASVALVAWLRYAVLMQPATTSNLLGPLFIAWLCTPRRQYRTGTGLVWFAIWWLALGFVTRKEIDRVHDAWDVWSVFSFLVVVTGVRMMKALSLDANDAMRNERDAGKTA